MGPVDTFIATIKRLKLRLHTLTHDPLPTRDRDWPSIRADLSAEGVASGLFKGTPPGCNDSLHAIMSSVFILLMPASGNITYQAQ